MFVLGVHVCLGSKFSLCQDVSLIWPSDIHASCKFNLLITVSSLLILGKWDGGSRMAQTSSSCQVALELSQSVGGFHAKLSD